MRIVIANKLREVGGNVHHVDWAGEGIYAELVRWRKAGGTPEASDKFHCEMSYKLFTCGIKNPGRVAEAVLRDLDANVEAYELADAIAHAVNSALDETYYFAWMSADDDEDAVEDG